MRRLLEVHMRDAVAANVMVLDEPELSVGSDGLHQLSSGIDVCRPLRDMKVRVGLSGGCVAVLGDSLQAVLLKVDSPASDAGLPRVMCGVGVDGSGADQAEEQKRPHFESGNSFLAVMLGTRRDP